MLSRRRGISGVPTNTRGTRRRSWPQPLAQRCFVAFGTSAWPPLAARASPRMTNCSRAHPVSN